MTDTPATLIARLGDCPRTEHLLKLFEYKRGMAEAHFPCPPLSETPWMDALLELAEKLDVAHEWADTQQIAVQRLLTRGDVAIQRAEAAEDEVERLKILNGNLRSELEDARRGS